MLAPITRAIPPNIGLLYKETRFHPERKQSKHQQPTARQQLTPTGVQTTKFQYSKTPERHNTFGTPIQSTGQKSKSLH
jgi:hypothetical protein